MKKIKSEAAIHITTDAIAANGSYTTDAYDVADLDGVFSLQWEITGDGTVKCEVLVSNDGMHFLDVLDDVFAGKTKSSDDGGRSIDGFEPPPCRQMKLRFTETGGVNTVTVDAVLFAI